MPAAAPLLLLIAFIACFSSALPYDGPLYDPTAYIECRAQPEDPLYRGGILGREGGGGGGGGADWNVVGAVAGSRGCCTDGPTFLLRNLTAATKYCFSSWVKIDGADSAPVRVSLKTDTATHDCVGTAIARRGCWSFLKGGFQLDSPSSQSLLSFKNSGGATDISIEIASPSLQPFSEQQWRANQQLQVNAARRRAVTIHVSDKNGARLEGAEVKVEQISKDFPLGSAIASTVIGNLPYQAWFVKRFNAAVFENELKWYATEPEPGKINYTLADRMLEFIRANQVIGRGHNIFWEDPKYTPSWVRNLTGRDLQTAVDSRIQSLMSKYQGEFIHWDVSNEMLHFDFYEQRLGPNATLHFFETAHRADPLATLFMNDFNVVETCRDVNSTVDAYISKLTELRRNGVSMGGVGLESHFTVPNPPLMRAVLDKLATLSLPIWLTEVDISKTFDKETQAIYLEEVLREGFSHPSVNGMMLWTALHPYGCYEMCLTDSRFRNLPAGDAVDKLLKEWQTGEITGRTDGYGSYSFHGFLGEYKASVSYGHSTTNSTFSLSRGDETKHFNFQL